MGQLRVKALTLVLFVILALILNPTIAQNQSFLSDTTNHAAHSKTYAILNSTNNSIASPGTRPNFPSIQSKHNQTGNKGVELDVFKGREAKLNRAIFLILSQSSPQIIYDISLSARKIKTLRKPKYKTVHRRVKALEQQRFLQKSGYRQTQSGVQAALYQLTTKAQVAMLLSEISPETFIEKADEKTLVTELAALTLFIAETEGTPPKYVF